MSRSNCIVFGLALYARRRRKGEEAYLVFRRSRFSRFCPHLLVMRRRKTGSWQLVSYKPTNPTERKLPPALFEGGSKFGDL